MYSAGAIRLFEAVKSIFDPANILNPGVLVAPRAVDDDLRRQQQHAALSRGPGMRLQDGGDDLARAVHRRTDVGKCVAESASAAAVMCPSFQATREEKDSTRGRARVLQEMMDLHVGGGFAACEVRAALDLCLSCKSCLSDCLTGVDMAAYKSDVLYQRYRRRLRPRSHYELGWLPRLARLSSRVPARVNALLRLPGVAWVAEQQLLPAVRAAGQGAFVLADGFSCRTQLKELAGRQAIHLAELLSEQLGKPDFHARNSNGSRATKASTSG